MRKMSYVLRQQRQEEAIPLKQKALEPHARYCCLKKCKVSVLIEFPDYKNPYNKGPEGAIYCENIVPCYQEGAQCRYSGISPLYPDPLRPLDSPEALEGLASNDPSEQDSPSDNEDEPNEEDTTADDDDSEIEPSD